MQSHFEALEFKISTCELREGGHNSAQNSDLEDKRWQSHKVERTWVPESPLGREDLSARNISIRCYVTKKWNFHFANSNFEICYSSEPTLSNTQVIENSTIPYWVCLLTPGINTLALGDEKRVQTKRNNSRAIPSQTDFMKLTVHSKFYSELKH